LIGGVVLGGLAGYSFASYLHQRKTQKDNRLHIDACNQHRRIVGNNAALHIVP
jgi:hypothetical protein